MAAGQTGKPGAAVPRRVAVEHKRACVLAPILLRPLVVLIVKEIDLRPNLATPMDAQVTVSQ